MPKMYGNDSNAMSYQFKTLLLDRVDCSSGLPSGYSNID